MIWWLYMIVPSAAFMALAGVLMVGRLRMTSRLPFVTFDAVRSEEADEEQAEDVTRAEIPAAKIGISCPVDADMFRITLRGSAAELLRSGKLFRTFLELYARGLLQRGVINADQFSLVHRYGAGIDEALECYRDSVPRSFQATVRTLYNMIMLALAFNIQVRKGGAEEMLQHWESELSHREKYPWDLSAPQLPQSLELIDGISVICEQMNCLPDWISRSYEADTESAFERLAELRARLKKMEQEMGVNA